MRNFRLDDESGQQEALFSWAAYNTGRMPELEYMHHVPNGGKRDAATAIALKRQGVKAGVPDICLPAPRGIYHGLYIELKAGKNTTTAKQRSWLDYLRQQGYFTAVCYGWQTAADAIKPLDIKGRIFSWEVRSYGNLYAVYEINALGGADELRALTHSKSAAEKIAELLENDQIEHFKATCPERVVKRDDGIDSLIYASLSVNTGEAM